MTSPTPPAAAATTPPLVASPGSAAAITPSPYGSPPGLPTDRDLVLRVMPLPSDANANGDIFGGWILAQIDIAGCVLPYRVARGRVTTVSVNEVVFKQAVSVGDLLSFYARIERIGRTSVTVSVEVYAERNPAAPEVVKVTQATVTYVAIDAQARPRPLQT